MMNLTLKINFDFGPYKKDMEVNVECDVFGIPLDLYWQRRVNDSKIDNCVSIVKAPELSDNTNSSPPKTVKSK